MEALTINELSGTHLSPIWVALSPRGLIAVEIGTSQQEFTQLLQRRFPGVEVVLDSRRTGEVTQQLLEYLEGKRREFKLSIDWSEMRVFQKQALQLTLAIPYGKTTTYGEIAQKLGSPKAARAVGRAEATNPMPLVIPCHRVIGADGGLHGYGAPGGVRTKSWLLQLERQ